MTHRNYANQNIQNYSFKGLDLTGADFHGADLRGCDFSGATLVGANLTGVQTGQSQRQTNRLLVMAVFAPATIVGLSFLVVQIPLTLFGNRLDQGSNFLMVGLPLLVFFLELLLRDYLTQRFPQTIRLLGFAAVATCFQIMAAFTILLAIICFSSFWDGSGAQGLFLLVITVMSAIVTRRIFKWVTESIHHSYGTSFRNANLIDANLSQALVQDTDFCFATLTGACISEWRLQHQTQFTHVNCEYLYLESDYQKRYPPEGKLLQAEAEAYLMGT
ncbi:pentapeptide repeat-containing protein [Pantanalinema sp. GBBB05]|uniref:pentapeptide repeat-containing protein n=1 Tax=Pantanalinema sp. GBBB05 TaxID=2604139 RepID=UPI001D4C3E4D|nr:pentapeptide repeat-containing protein [Pantanalinema sp. GBBB05]